MRLHVGYFFGAHCSLGLLLIKRLIDSSLIVKKSDNVPRSVAKKYNMYLLLNHSIK